MSFSGLRSFLRGGLPQPATRTKLVTWYAHSRRRHQDRIATADVDTAIALLSLYLTEARGAQERRRRLRLVIDRLSSDRPTAS